MTLAWAGVTAAVMGAVHFSPAVREARKWRAARLEWQERAPRYGLADSHLIHREDTRLGDMRVIDTRGCRRLASQIASSTLAELIAQHEDPPLPPSRVKVSAGKVAGRVVIHRRLNDPWEFPVPHPLLDPDPEPDLYEKMTAPYSVKRPAIVGQDPEYGTPLLLPLWDEIGAKNVLIVGKKGAGKTVFMSCIRERVTAAPDGRLVIINVSKAPEDHAWAPACYMSAVGRRERKKAAAILRHLRRIIEERGDLMWHDAVLQPTARQPLIVVMIDEIDALTGGRDQLAIAIKENLAYVASKGRSVGVALVIAGQRGTADWLGGSNIRTQVNVVCVGKVNRRGEIMHAAGDGGYSMPNMATYGEGNEGVWAIGEIGEEYQLGRTFLLKELADIRRLARDRGPGDAPLEAELVERLPDSHARLTGYTATAGGPPSDGSTPSGPPRGGVAVLDPPGGGGPEGGDGGQDHDPLDQDHQGRGQDGDHDPLAEYDHGSLEDALPEDLRRRLAEIDRRRAEARDITEQNNAVTFPDVNAGALTRAREERWRQAAAQASIPDDARERLLGLLAGEGSSTPAAATALGVSKWTMRVWLEKLRGEGLVRVVGEKRGARWILDTPGDGDSQ